MNTLAMNDTADNGVRVSTVVTLDIDAIGVPIEAQDIDPRPFLVKTYVSGNGMYHSFHKTRAEAHKAAEKMHAAYLEVHAEKVAV